MKAIELDPFNTKALYRLSEAYIGLSNFEKATEVINKCLEVSFFFIFILFYFLFIYFFFFFIRFLFLFLIIINLNLNYNI